MTLGHSPSSSKTFLRKLYWGYSRGGDNSICHNELLVGREGLDVVWMQWKDGIKNSFSNARVSLFTDIASKRGGGCVNITIQFYQSYNLQLCPIIHFLGFIMFLLGSAYIEGHLPFKWMLVCWAIFMGHPFYRLWNWRAGFKQQDSWQ